MQDIYHCDNVLSKQELLPIYEMLMKQSWSIYSAYESQTTYSNSYPSKNIYQDGQAFDPLLTGYFSGLAYNVNRKLREKYNWELPINKITKIQMNAQKKGSVFNFHQDGTPDMYSMIGFLTPEWQDSWGGTLQIEGETVKYRPGDFVVFKSNYLHDAMPILEDTPWYRISVGMFFKP